MMSGRIPAILNRNYKANGTKSYVRALVKYGFTPTLDGPYRYSNRVAQQGKFATAQGTHVGGKAHIQRVLQKQTGDQAGDVPADDIQNDTEYLASVGIGTPAQNLNLDFDTGSADLWVWSTELPSSVTSGASGHSIFDSSKSSTFKSSAGQTWQISYGDGSSASGNVGTDNVNLGGLVIKNQAIELAQTMSSQFTQSTGDGLLGLAFGSINTVKPSPVQTPMENLISQDDIPQSAELFTAHLGAAAESNDQSFYTFGYIDQTVVQQSGQQIAYTPIDNSQGFWMFDSTSATINGKTVQRSGNTAIADTGTTLALVDDNTCQQIYAAIPGSTYDSSSQGYIFPTSTTTAQLPTITFAVGNTQFAVHKEALSFSPAKTGYVYGGIQSRGSMTFDILGDTFLKGIYAVFDVGNNQFGGVQRPDPATATSAGTGTGTTSSSYTL